MTFGPPASGKAAIGSKVAEALGYRFFHNHLTANPVAALFGWVTPKFGEVLDEVRDLLFERAAQVLDILEWSSLSSGPSTNPRRPKQLIGCLRSSYVRAERFTSSNYWRPWTRGFNRKAVPSGASTSQTRTTRRKQPNDNGCLRRSML
ncbi:MAG: hypothetical protein HKP41_16220 [Desulfobacterales bacterium]|nr:hypothetical protein [Desulfobacterales bacterium]